jgi:hypothetical protein
VDFFRVRNPVGVFSIFIKLILPGPGFEPITSRVAGRRCPCILSHLTQDLVKILNYFCLQLWTAMLDNLFFYHNDSSCNPSFSDFLQQNGTFTSKEKCCWGKLEMSRWCHLHKSTKIFYLYKVQNPKIPHDLCT